MSADQARSLLHRLLNRYEKPQERVRAIQEKPPQSFAGAEERRTLESLLRGAEEAGAVTLTRDRGESAHLIARVTLADAGQLYAFLGRAPKADAIAEAIASLQAASAVTKAGREAVDRIAEAWSRQNRPYGLSHEDLAETLAFIRVLDAAVSKPEGDRTDLRTYSRRTTGDSKLIERQGRRIAAHLRAIGEVAADLSDDEVMSELGLEKFPHPVLVSGPVAVGGMDASDQVYVGIAPDHAYQLRLTQPARSILTIENLASFNRHIREARKPGDVVVYTGGFPSRAVAAAIRALATAHPGPILHWGDIDAGGVRIAARIEREIPGRFGLHLMTPELALAHGAPCAPMSGLHVPEGSIAAPLAAFLAGESAATLEQEEIDPQAPPAA